MNFLRQEDVAKKRGNWIVEYAYTEKLYGVYTPMIGYWRCWAATAQDAITAFSRTNRHSNGLNSRIVAVYERKKVAT